VIVPADPNVVAALTAALDANPDDVGLRLHLAGALVDGGEPEAADPHVNRVLAADPAHVDALRLGARVAEALGQLDRALGYRRLLTALGRDSGPTATTSNPSPSVPPPPASRQTPPPPPPAVAVPADGPTPDDGFDDIVAGLDSIDSDIERPTLCLDDVGGMEAVKEQLWVDFLGPMQNDELRALYGTSLGGGLLLYGPPGCGKTFLARALAGELGTAFLTVGLHEVLDMWIGQSEHNVHELFEKARDNAPCLLFLDEIDALGQKRSHLRHSAGRNVVVQLLSELDGMGSRNEGIFVLGATNLPWDVDPALRRPGRFDRTVLVLPPDEPARLAILQSNLSGRPVAALDLPAIASRTDGYSGADVRQVAERAARVAMADSMRTGSARPIEQRDLFAALGEVSSSIGPWLDVAKNFAEFGDTSGEYADLLRYLRRRR
jgi:AAA+ superfamily predicted ATPase